MKFSTYMYKSFLFALTLSALATTGCKSVDQRVTELVDEKQFEVALQELRKAKVAPDIEQDADPKAVIARNIYQQSLEAHIAEKTAAQTKTGDGRAAYLSASEGEKLCSWSVAIADLSMQKKRIVSGLDHYQEVAGRYSIYSDKQQLIGLLKDWGLPKSIVYRNQSNDSPQLRSDMAACRERLLGLIAEESSKPSWVDSKWSKDKFYNELLLTNSSRMGAQKTADAFNLIHPERRSQITNEWIDELQQSTSVMYESPALSELVNAYETAFIYALSDEVYEPKDDEDANLETAISAQELADRALSKEYGDYWRLTEARVCIERAREISKDPNVAPLAWVMSERAREILRGINRLDETTESDEEIVNRAIDTMTGIEIRGSLNINPEIDLSLQELLEVQIKTIISQSASGRTSLTWVNHTDARQDFEIYIHTAILEYPRLEDLAIKQSQFLSHYEDVPNPEKERLRRRLDSQRISVDLAESSLSSSISSHNIYPTQWSLASVNMARSTYSLAVSNYNSLVNRFNITPSTVSRPVKLPYSFQEGNVEFGIQASGRVKNKGYEIPFHFNDIDTDLVRTGVKSTDTNPRYRRNDTLDIDCSIQSLLEKLQGMGETVQSQAAEVILKVPVDARVELSALELKSLRWIDHPFKNCRAGSGEDYAKGWVRTLGLEYHDSERFSSTTSVALSRNPLGSGESTGQRDLAINSTCQIASYSDNGKPLGTQSGAIISQNGMILTCDHGLIGSDIRIKFFEGPNIGEYQARILKTNPKTDVAILQAEGIKASNWLEVQSEPATRGQSIYAVGNPSLDSNGNIAHLAMTNGTVVTPLGESFGTSRLVADLPIASGSSGGPIVSSETGKIIGVVTAVALEEFGPDRASTKSMCLAAPAEKLQEWLGIYYPSK